MTASTFLRRARAFALRVTDNFHGVFLALLSFSDDTRDARLTIRDHRTRQTLGGMPRTCRRRGNGKKVPSHAGPHFQPPTQTLSVVSSSPSLTTTTTMAVEIQTMPTLNGHAFNGDTDMNKEPSLRFASGLILPPPEIKCESSIRLDQSLRADTPFQLSSTEPPSSSRAQSTPRSSRTRFARISVRIPSSRSSTLRTLIMLTIGIVWTEYLPERKWRKYQRTRQQWRVKKRLWCRKTLVSNHLSPNSSWICQASVPLICKSRAAVATQLDLILHTETP